MRVDPTVWILDVGHGSATVVEQDGHVVIVDGGRRDTLPQFLEERGVFSIDDLIISHVDADHFGGLSLLLSKPEFKIGRVYVNPDPRGTALWRDFGAVMRDARDRGTQFFLELNAVNPGRIEHGGVACEILAPSQELAARTPVGADERGRRLSSNSMSAVVRIAYGDQPCVLVPSDIDDVGLDSLLASERKPTARVLVFPHHGGRPGRGDPAEFAARLVGKVGPALVVFSIGRGEYGTPRPEVVAAVRSAAAHAHIACTQLSERCTVDVPVSGDHLVAPYGRGSRRGICCSGTVRIPLTEPTAYVPRPADHVAFVDRFAPTALCRGRGVLG